MEDYTRNCYDYFIRELHQQPFADIFWRHLSIFRILALLLFFIFPRSPIEWRFGVCIFFAVCLLLKCGLWLRLCGDCPRLVALQPQDSSSWIISHARVTGTVWEYRSVYSLRHCRSSWIRYHKRAHYTQTIRKRYRNKHIERVISWIACDISFLTSCSPLSVA